VMPGTSPVSSITRSPESRMPDSQGVIQFDPSSCRLCRACELVCSLTHEGACSLTLSRLHLSTSIFDSHVEMAICRQCRRPRCVSVCPTQAISIHAGVVLIDEALCVGCGDCVSACPFNAGGRVIFVPAAHAHAIKCDLCGGEPQCVQVCPTQALTLERDAGELYT